MRRHYRIERNLGRRASAVDEQNDAVCKIGAPQRRRCFRPFAHVDLRHLAGYRWDCGLHTNVMINGEQLIAILGRKDRRDQQHDNQEKFVSHDRRIIPEADAVAHLRYVAHRSLEVADCV